MDIYDIGYDDSFLPDEENPLLTIARVFAQHKEQFSICTGEIILSAEISGKYRYCIETSEDLPVVGDWVLVSIHDELAIIHRLLPRRSILARKSVHSSSERQLIVANVDYAFIVQGLDRDFNLNRLDRYIAMSCAGKIIPIIILNKADLLATEEIEEKKQLVVSRHPDISIIISSFTQDESIQEIKNAMQAKKTYCFVGSSGVGKSTLINKLFGKEILITTTLSASTNKGQHTTTHRQLFVMNEGPLVIDTPGMRELGVIGAMEGVENTFKKIYEKADRCKFKDCTHLNEVGCAVKEALESGEINQDEFASYKKLQKEESYNSSTMLERRQKDKQFGKMVKQVMSNKKNR
ncbi:MAG: ribosome small subunit-dependent GTPase A [Candidatus Margulisbacteria bacterium GWF2_35_9]|nr:MAG: ribosome small subunit-dependent GTPase A [Candidatus Margulisbacteria bacterium GWF2_35_9]